VAGCAGRGAGGRVVSRVGGSHGAGFEEREHHGVIVRGERVRGVGGAAGGAERRARGGEVRGGQQLRQRVL
jgi:hypothetical protein